MPNQLQNMNVGIVGSRTFPQLKLVEWFVRDLPGGVTVISGGATGVDSAAVNYARQRGLVVREHLPNLDGCSQRHEFTERYYARNQQIVDDSDLLVAFTEKDSGGTWDTIKRAKRAGKSVKIIKPSAFFPGDSMPQEEEIIKDEDAIEPEEVSPQQAARSANRGKGPFAIKRVSLGSYALRRKCYIDAEEWASIVTEKDDAPESLANRIAPVFLKFFEDNRRLGTLHAVTVSPRSTRNINKAHVMDFVGAKIGESLAVPFVRMFEPWEKSSRGRHAKHGEIKITDAVKPWIGKVVWVLDDVTTTNFTLRAAVQSLIALEIHAHGLVYVLMA